MTGPLSREDPPDGWRRHLTYAGGVGLALGLLAAAVPGAAALVPVGPVVALLGDPYFVVAAFAVAGACALGWALSVRVREGIDQSTPPAPESVVPVPRPGQALDEALSGVDWAALLPPDRRPARSVERRRTVRERLRRAAVAATVDAMEVDRETAAALVADGRWTDDPVAAAFLAVPGPAADRPWDDGETLKDRGADLRGRIVATLTGASPFQRRVRRTAESVVAALNDDRDDADVGPAVEGGSAGDGRSAVDDRVDRDGRGGDDWRDLDGWRGADTLTGADGGPNESATEVSR